MANQIEGLDRLRRKLKALPVRAKARIREAMESAAEEIVMMMKALAPVDDGDLQMSISWTWGKAPKGAMTIATVKGAGGELLLTIFAGNAKAFYARWVEFGTNAHLQGGKFAGTQHPGTTAQPFFYVSFRALRRRVKGRVSRAITKSAKEVAAGK